MFVRKLLFLACLHWSFKVTFGAQNISIMPDRREESEFHACVRQTHALHMLRFACDIFSGISANILQTFFSCPEGKSFKCLPARLSSTTVKVSLRCNTLPMNVITCHGGAEHANGEQWNLFYATLEQSDRWLNEIFAKKTNWYCTKKKRIKWGDCEHQTKCCCIAPSILHEKWIYVLHIFLISRDMKVNALSSESLDKIVIKWKLSFASLL